MIWNHKLSILLFKSNHSRHQPNAPLRPLYTVSDGYLQIYRFMSELFSGLKVLSGHRWDVRWPYVLTAHSPPAADDNNAAPHHLMRCITKIWTLRCTPWVQEVWEENVGGVHDLVVPSRGFVYISFICLCHMLKIVGLFSGIVEMGLREMFGMKRWMQNERGKR